MAVRSQGIPGIAVGAIAVGALLMYSGIKDVPVVDALRAIIRGQMPTPRTVTVDSGMTQAELSALIANANATQTLPRTSTRDPNAPGLK